MAKTKPIGVRFDEDILGELKEQGRADSPQKALNYLTDFYRQNGKDKDWMLNFAKKAYAESQNKLNTAPISTKKVSEQPKEGDNGRKEEKNEPAVNSLKTKDGLKTEWIPIPEIDNPMPIRLPGEDALEFAARKNEWKKLQK